MKKQRVHWGSRLGFILAVAGSAVGLGNIWRFPYVVGEAGGSAFIILYFVCLFLVGFPVLIAEILIGRTAQRDPSGAFTALGGPRWGWVGKLTILTGFIVSSFYSAVAGWILGYFVEAMRDGLTHFQCAEDANVFYCHLIDNPLWVTCFHFLFCALSTGVLYFGVRHGIERGNKIMMPLLFLLLLLIVVRGVLLPGGMEGVSFLLQPDWRALTPAAFLLALGQSFFTLSCGQGTMVTYGSYLSSRENIVKNCFPILLMDTLVALFAAVAVFAIVFSAHLQPDQGPGLLFTTLPLVFSQLSGGYYLAIFFFLLVLLAALSSEISAMEPTISYLSDEWGWRRKPAVMLCGFGVFLLGIPSALSFSLLRDVSLFGRNFLDFMSFMATSILIPIGGLCAVLLVGWKWGLQPALSHLQEGAQDYYAKRPWLLPYLRITMRFIAPLLIILVFLQALQLL